MSLSQSIACPSGLVHLEWVFRPWAWLVRLGLPAVGIVRTFLTPLSALDPASGQPTQQWNWSCVAVVRGKTMTIHCVLRAPLHPTVGELENAAAALGMTHLAWEHWHVGRKLLRGTALAPCDWTVLNFPPKSFLERHR